MTFFEFPFFHPKRREINIDIVDSCYKANIIDPEGTNGKRIGVMFTFDRNTDIGKIQLGDEFFACVSANALNPPSGIACEKRHVKSFDEPNVLAAGHLR